MGVSLASVTLFLPGVGTAVLGSMAGIFGAVVTLLLLGVLVGTGVTGCTLTASSPWRLLEVGTASSPEKGWMEESLDDLAFLVTVKPGMTELENVVARKGPGVDAWEE